MNLAPARPEIIEGKDTAKILNINTCDVNPASVQRLKRQGSLQPLRICYTLTMNQKLFYKGG